MNQDQAKQKEEQELAGKCPTFKFAHKVIKGCEDADHLDVCGNWVSRILGLAEADKDHLAQLIQKKFRDCKPRVY